MFGIKTIEVTPTITAGAYTSNDVIGGLMTFHAPYPNGIIKSIVVTCKDNEKAALDLHLYNAVPTAILDNAAFAPSDADTAKEFRKVLLLVSDYTSNGSLNAIGQALNVNQGFDTTDGNIYLYAVLPIGVTYTAVGDLVFKMEVWPY